MQWKKPQEQLISLFNQTDIDHLDLFNSFTVNGAKSKIFYLYADGIHFSPLGHAIIADEVIKYLSLKQTHNPITTL